MSNKKISIIILTWNKLKITKKCIRFLENNINYPNLEIIIIDNGSVDGTPEFLKKLKESNKRKYKIILNKSNLGYAKGINQGIRISEGYYIILLNNDVYITRDCLTSMIEKIENDRKNVIVGAKLIYPNTMRIQHAGIVFIPKIEPLHIFKNCSYNDPRVNKSRNIDAVTGALMLIKREIFENIGYFDENFKYGGFEDTDFCLRCRIKGYKIIYSSNSIAFHDERATTNQLNKYYQIYNYNFKRFRNKWARILDNYNNKNINLSFKLKMYIIYGVFKLFPKKLEFLLKKILTEYFSVK